MFHKEMSAYSRDTSFGGFKNHDTEVLHYGFSKV
jgi:hypothetical protein